MKYSTDRILTTHAGALPQPPDLKQMHIAKDTGKPLNEDAFHQRVRLAVSEVVKKQISCGLDIINDGEVGKSNFSRYAGERLSGFVERDAKPGDQLSTIFARDMVEFGEYFRNKTSNRGDNVKRVFCNGPLKYIGQRSLHQEIDDFKAGLEGQNYQEAFLPAIAPGTIEHWMKNDYYPDDEAYLIAIAEAMHEEYKAIVDAGFLLQIDDPDLPDGWQFMSRMTVEEYRKYAELRVDALNHGLRDIPPDKVRFHTCWGSYHGPHKYDRYRRASSGDRRSSAALRQAPGARKGNRRYRLRPGTESRRSANRLGEVPGDGGRRAHREQAAMGKMKPLLIAVKGPCC